jgi:hypothetical protein
VVGQHVHAGDVAGRAEEVPGRSGPVRPPRSRASCLWLAPGYRMLKECCHRDGRYAAELGEQQESAEARKHALNRMGCCS